MQNETVDYIEHVWGKGCFRQEVEAAGCGKTSKDVEHDAEVVDSE